MGRSVTDIGCFRFMSTAMGFRYLFDAGYIDREMDMWLNVSLAITFSFDCLLKFTQDRNVFYVIQVEIFLSKVFGYSNGEEDEDILYAPHGSSNAEH